ncbi:hypothetical protein B0A49_02313 [Cryomyces minteri]|uniref:Ribosome recycling factor domain-containing protein n=1 Tax=Cryomyces minteri TaxID=331657 RepID=A0A4U0XIV0_9PEZI|nr:hypothetical protein B0A49_02313 [Cryomyces minteri]
MSAPLPQKGGKATRAQSADAPSSSPSSSAPPAADDPFDFSVLEADIVKVHERLQHELKKLRSGGRFNPEVLEALRVHLVKGGKESVRLGDVAQVIPKGRVVQLIVGEKDSSKEKRRAHELTELPGGFQHIKPITSAILSSTLSLTPQPDPANPSLLSIPIPPPTADSRRAAIAEAQDAAKAATEAIRNARGTQQKKLRAMQLGKKALPDDLRKAAPLMEKLVEKGTKEVTRILDAAKKVLEA